MTNTSGFKQKVPHLPFPPPPTNKKGEITSAIKHRQALHLARKQGNTELRGALSSSSSKTREKPSFLVCLLHPPHTVLAAAPTARLATLPIPLPLPRVPGWLTHPGCCKHTPGRESPALQRWAGPSHPAGTAPAATNTSQPTGLLFGAHGAPFPSFLPFLR